MTRDIHVPSGQDHEHVPVLATPKTQVIDKARVHTFQRILDCLIPHTRERSTFRDLENSKVGTERILSEDKDLFWLGKL